MEISGKKRNTEEHFLQNSSPDTQHLEKQGLVGEGTVAGGQALGSLGT